MNWRTIDENDLSATISQGEIEAFRRDGSLDGSDPVARLLERTVDHVRGLVSCNGTVRMGPAGTIPASLISPAMDYAAYDVLKRQDIIPNDARTDARKRAEEIFDKIASGNLGCESYSEDGAIDEDKRPASAPAYAPATPERLLD